MSIKHGKIEDMKGHIWTYYQYTQIKQIFLYRSFTLLYWYLESILFHIFRSKHRMQTRHFDRISTRNATLFHLAVETVLLGVVACLLSAFLAVRRLQTDGQPGFVQDIGHAALRIGLFQSAEVRVLLGERRQSVSQSSIVGLDVGDVLALAEKYDGFLLILRQLCHSYPPCCRFGCCQG